MRGLPWFPHQPICSLFCWCSFFFSCSVFHVLVPHKLCNTLFLNLASHQLGSHVYYRLFVLNVFLPACCTTITRFQSSFDKETTRLREQSDWAQHNWAEPIEHAGGPCYGPLMRNCQVRDPGHTVFAL
ncbi:hypothetical protein BGW80DRAFT_1299433 [Lactifluus volemus]|nr:hypothetical protein BGW80DRAFT_1299433 [Lactifluus volemus]